MQNNFYHPQMKFGARKYFHKYVSRILSTGGACSGGGLLPGHVCSWGVCSGGVSAPGGSAPGGLGGCLVLGGAWWRPPNGYCCGWYASYRNAFLFKVWTIWAVSTVNFNKSLLIREVTSLMTRLRI